VIAFANPAQSLTLRLGVRRVLPVGLALTAAALVLYARLPVDGQYFWDLFPGFLLGGIGMALAFIPLTIGALAGTRPEEAGVASGLVNTGQQIGGAVGVAAATTIAATATSHYLAAHPGAADAGLTHGFGVAFYTLAGVAALAAVLSVLIIEPRREADAQPDELERGEPALEAAA
jgi:MFS family permease